MFSESRLEKHGNPYLQASWDPSELESFLPSGQERVAGKFNEEPEERSRHGVLASGRLKEQHSTTFKGINKVDKGFGSQVSKEAGLAITPMGFWWNELEDAMMKM